MLKFNLFQVFVTIFITPIGINVNVKSTAVMFCPILLQIDVPFKCDWQFLYRFNFLSGTFCLQSPQIPVGFLTVLVLYQGLSLCDR